MEKDNKKENEFSEDVEKIMYNLNEFMIPKFKSFQEDIKENVSIFKLLKISKKFIKDAEIEYKEKFNRDFLEDMNIIKEKYNSNFDFNDISNLFKNIKS